MVDELLKAWRREEQRLLERWHRAIAEFHEAHLALAGFEPSLEPEPFMEALMLRAGAATAELNAVRREVNRIRAEFASGRRERD
ncbi:MAG TPA: hypothetical protein VEG36_04140 [Burkholderiales bacterium]|nr:hypothetical protein [Burkholderiales bacterium]